MPHLLYTQNEIYYFNRGIRYISIEILFFLNPHTWSLLRHAHSRVDLRIARKFEFDRNNLDLQKSQRHGKVHQGTFTQNRVESVLVPKCRSKCR